ncbi:MAG: sulfotransferase family 2 domain-containing protein [Rhodobacter sp.]|nr:sulfotransferase family 2 domain-containing protein [Rhodobacter sp.]
MISHEHKFIFIHLRRTGGNSIENALGGIRLYDRSGKETRNWDDTLHRGPSQYKENYRGHYLHDDAMKVRDLFPEEFKTYLKFSIVRNPWAQCLSLFFRLNKGNTDPQAFRDFIQNALAVKGTVPHYSIFDEDGKCLVDYIGRFETIDEDFAHICRKLGLTGIRLPHHNRSLSTDYRRFYDAETAQRVSEIYAEDIKRFGYAFDAPEGIGPGSMQ